jgi:hypothetical protein
MPSLPKNRSERTHRSYGFVAALVLLVSGCFFDDDIHSNADAGGDGGYEADAWPVEPGDAASPQTDSGGPDQADSSTSDGDAAFPTDSGNNPSGGDDAADPSPSDGGSHDGEANPDAAANPLDGGVVHELDSGTLNDAGSPAVDSSTAPVDTPVDAGSDAAHIPDGGAVIDAAQPNDPLCTSSFEAPRRWTSASSLDPGELVALANNERGDIVAVFNRRSVTTQTLWARYAEPGETFGDAVPLGETTGDGGVKVALNALGDAFVVWVASADSGASLVAARFAKSSGWAGVTEPVTTSTSLTVGGIALRLDGRATVGWMEPVNPGFVLPGRFSAKEFVPGTGWHQAASLELNHLFTESLNGQPAWESTPSGALMLMWANREANDYASLWSSRYTPAAGWEAAVRLHAPSSVAGVAHAVSFSSDMYRASLVVAKDGSAIATWQEFDFAQATPTAGSHVDLYMSRYNPGAGWGTPEVIPTYPRPLPTAFRKRSAMQPLVVGNQTGDLVAFWFEGLFQLRGTLIGEGRLAMSYSPALGWGPLARFSDNFTFVPSVARVDCAGNGLATDAAFTSTLLYRANVGFAGPSLVDVQSIGARTAPQLLIDHAGRTIAAWNVAGSAWWSRYQPDPT